MLRDLLLVLNMLVCLALIGVVLMQRSEGGAFGTGGSPTGLVTARGAGDLLTRTTWVLFTLFLAFSLALTLIGGRERSSQAILQRLKTVTVNPDQLARPTPPAPASPSPGAPVTGQNPATAAPPALQLPPIGSSATPKPHPAHNTRTLPMLVAPPSEPAKSSSTPAPALPTPAPLALPPLPAPTNSTTKPPTP
jgi:preprotein translocase subunit SecG